MRVNWCSRVEVINELGECDKPFWLIHSVLNSVYFRTDPWGTTPVTTPYMKHEPVTTTMILLILSLLFVHTPATAHPKLTDIDYIHHYFIPKFCHSTTRSFVIHPQQHILTVSHQILVLHVPRNVLQEDLLHFASKWSWLVCTSQHDPFGLFLNMEATFPFLQ